MGTLGQDSEGGAETSLTSHQSHTGYWEGAQLLISDPIRTSPSECGWGSILLAPSSHTCLLTTSGVMLGTSRMENLPTTLRGMTVLAPEPEKAPSMPWSDKDGKRQRCMSKSVCRQGHRYCHQGARGKGHCRPGPWVVVELRLWQSLSLTPAQGTHTQRAGRNWCRHGLSGSTDMVQAGRLPTGH